MCVFTRIESPALYKDNHYVYMDTNILILTRLRQYSE